MTAADLARLKYEDLELEFNYTADQIRRLYSLLEELSRGRRGFKPPLLQDELITHKANFQAICAEFERRYIP